MPKPDKTLVKQSNDINHQAIKGLAKTRVGVLFRSDSGEEFYSKTRYTLLCPRIQKRGIQKRVPSEPAGAPGPSHPTKASYTPTVKSNALSIQ
jgi:hypothetical protein